jgi:hypothetical protein
MAEIRNIRDAVTAQPFRPFALHLVNGTVHHIRHPDWIAIPPARRRGTVIVFSPIEGEEEGYRSNFVDVRLIAEIVVPAEQPGGSA